MEQTLGKRIVTRRKGLGLTQDALAEQLGVTAQAVSKWENDQSCPDIAMLPKLAEIFGISTDELLGMEKKTIHEAEVITEEASPERDPVSTGQERGTWEFRLDNSRRGSLGMAILVLLVGGLLLAGYFLNWPVTFWEVLWPSALLIYGLFGILPRPSFFRIGCLIFGAYFLLHNLSLLPGIWGRGMIFPLVLVLFGLSLLADALRRPQKRRFHIIRNGKHLSGSHEGHCTTEGEHFVCCTSFGESYRELRMPRVSSGNAEVSFGELTVDLTQCGELVDGARLSLDCSFGELALRVPRTCHLEVTSSTAFGEVEVKGSPAPDAEVTVYAECSANFGEITLRYM